MIRIAAGSAMMAVGYLLVYAAVDHKGRYALRPWDALGKAA